MAAVEEKCTAARWLILIAVVLCVAMGSLAEEEASDMPEPQEESATSLPRISVSPAQPYIHPDPASAILNPGDASSLSTSYDDSPPTEDDKRGQWLLAPIPSSSPSLGAGLTVIAGYVFKVNKNDDVSPPSQVGVAAYGSENDSMAVGLGARLNLKEDRWRVTTALAHGDINYTLYGQTGLTSGLSVPISQTLDGGLVKVLREIKPDFYLGLSYFYGQTEADFDIELPWWLARRLDVPRRVTDNIDSTLELDLASFGLHAQYDSRDSQFYPTTGTNFTLDFTIFTEAAGSDVEYQVFKTTYNRFWPIKERGVLAVRAMTRMSFDDPPFFGESSFGMGSDLRGYVAGRHRERMMYAVQSEYRHKFTERWGAVGFAGFGEVADTVGDFDLDVLPSIGGGIRFTLSKEHNINLRLDVATGKDDTEIYFGVGEAF